MTRAHSRRRWRSVIVMALTLSLAFGLVGGHRFWYWIEYRWFDFLTVQTAPHAATLPIVVIGIDDASLAALQQRWPWPREIHARLIDKLAAAGVSVVAFDVIFDQPTDPANDAALAESIRQAGNVVLAANPYRQETAFGLLSGIAEPLPILRQAGARVGLVAVEMELDRGVRRLPNRDDAFWRRIVEGLRRANPSMAPPPPLPERPLLRYLGPDHSFPYLPYHQVLDTDIEPLREALAGSLVLIGRDTRATGELGAAQTDMFYTPFTAYTGRDTPGVEIHATAVDNALRGVAIGEVPWQARLALLLVAMGLGTLLLSRFHGWWSLGATLGLAGGALGLSYALFIWLGLWLPPLGAVTALALFYVARAVDAFVVEQRQKQRIKRIFSLYVPAAVAERLAQQEEESLALGGEQRELTLMFTDLADFTSAAELLTPQQTARLLNVYFGGMTEAIFEHQGTVDKFIGDAVMAFWGAPLPDTHHADHAVAAARAMLEAEAVINARLSDEGLPPVSTRIGIHTGEAVVGNMGAPKRFNYTALGDTVNLAARLEGLNKRYGSRLLVSGATVARLRDKSGLRLVERVRVKGKQETVEVYTPCPDPWLVEQSAFALDYYCWQDWDKAEQIWNEIVLRYPDDLVGLRYLARISELRFNPPAEGWDGAESMSEK
ncbi:CHASE2 domain-containing protein [Chitinimonas lacunae]|uniref:CHASE2 domain-containing protein n=1 Tax=Chitinimonas lacunae TaxID=1963018 RepID=A0ABV8MNV9_9NEIS